MKTNELRIGNFLLTNNRIVNVVGIDNDECAIKAHDDTMFVGVGEFHPISLTEEWLLKFGFKKKYSIYPIPKGSYSFEIEGKMSLDDYENGTYGFGVEDEINENSIFLELKYVHQLQNLWFALKGEELEINL